MRRPVKLPGPIPTASAPRSPGRAPPWRSSASTSSSSVAPATPLAEHLAAVDERARRHLRRSVERQRQHSSIETTLRPPPACRKWTESAAEAARPRPPPAIRRTRSSRRSTARGPPLRRRDPVEPVEVEVRDLALRAVVAVADRVRRARHVLADAERLAGAADERRLARAELAGRPSRRRRAPGARQAVPPVRRSPRATSSRCRSWAASVESRRCLRI